MCFIAMHLEKPEKFSLEKFGNKVQTLFINSVIYESLHQLIYV
jgi:hypothetical protein